MAVFTLETDYPIPSEIGYMLDNSRQTDIRLHLKMVRF